MSSTLSSPAPASTVSAHAPASATAPVRAPRWKPVLGIIAALLVLGWLGRIGLHAYHYVHTDDAYVTGHLHHISPQIDGQVKEVLVADNQTVRAGEVLARLDPLQYELAVQKARAGLEQARAQASQVQVAVTQADAQLAEAEARARQAEAQIAQTAAQLEVSRLALARTEELFTKNQVVAQADLDNARGAFRATEAAHSANQANAAAAQSSIATARAAQTAAQAQIVAAQASVNLAEVALRDAGRLAAHTTLVAPAAGRVGNKRVEVGNRVVAGQTLFSLAAPEPWIVANFKETQLTRMHEGQQVEFEIDAIPGEELHGRIESFAPASGAQFALLPPDNSSGNFNKVVQRVPVKIVLDDASQKAISDRVRLGLSVVVNVRVR